MEFDDDLMQALDDDMDFPDAPVVSTNQQRLTPPSAPRRHPGSNSRTSRATTNTDNSVSDSNTKTGCVLPSVTRGNGNKRTESDMVTSDSTTNRTVFTSIKQEPSSQSRLLNPSCDDQGLPDSGNSSSGVHLKRPSSSDIAVEAAPAKRQTSESSLSSLPANSPEPSLPHVRGKTTGRFSFTILVVHTNMLI